jgi:hypothetical protein
MFVSWPARAAAPGMALLLLSGLLSGCVDMIPDASVAKGEVRATVARGSAGSPKNATMALASLSGATPELDARFQQILAKQAADREITIVDPQTAHYLVRGYLSAAPGETGTDVAYLYDIFDANSQTRIDRVQDTLTVPSQGGDAWAVVDDKVMESLAARSADELAAALAGTPVAQAALNPAAAPSQN